MCISQDIRKKGLSNRNAEKSGHSYTLVEKWRPIIYQAKRGAIRHAPPYYAIYRKLLPPPPPRHHPTNTHTEHRSTHFRVMKFMLGAIVKNKAHVQKRQMASDKICQSEQISASKNKPHTKPPFKW